MNYTRRFEDDVANFCGRSHLSYNALLSDYDNGTVFCYVKNVGNFYPSAVSFTDAEDRVTRVLCDYENEPIPVAKAENLIDFRGMENDRLVRRTLDGKLYYVARGMLFNCDKSPIALNCFVRGARSFDRTMCFSIGVFKDPEDPVHRFILRKLIPYLAEKRYDFSFANCNAFVLKPIFQGRLNHSLVGEFLADKIYKDLNEPEQQQPRQRHYAPVYGSGVTGTAAASTASSFRVSSDSAGTSL